jgi:elongation factor Ts
MAISASEVKALRESTGAGMMDCKKALTDAEGDTQKAVELLRERGLSKAGKRAGRDTGEGAIAIALSGGNGTIVELGCETDFVAKTDDFQALAQQVADIAGANTGLSDADAVLVLADGSGTVADIISATASRVGENIVLKRVAQVSVEKGLAGGYIHAGGKLGVVVAVESSADAATLNDSVKGLAMHVAAVDPTPVSIDRSGVPAEALESERTILRKQALDSGKPENIVEKIVEGRINKFYAENCLVEQAFVKDPDTTVGKMLEAASSDVKVAAMVRFKLGEAI